MNIFVRADIGNGVRVDTLLPKPTLHQVLYMRKTDTA